MTVGELGGVHAVRADGGLVRIRHAVPADLPALREFHLAASDRSFYLRFFGLNRAAAEEYVRRLGRPPSPAHHSLTAWIAGRLVGVATYERLTDDSAELALLSPTRDLWLSGHARRRHGHAWPSSVVDPTRCGGGRDSGRVIRSGQRSSAQVRPVRRMTAAGRPDRNCHRRRGWTVLLSICRPGPAPWDAS